jgi:methylenetetrahydrofolate dehydrogenase (NADP+)/methenyltetrahydrofolate cyclohydrolase
MIMGSQELQCRHSARKSPKDLIAGLLIEKSMVRSAGCLLYRKELKMQYIDCKKYAQEILDEVKSIPNKGNLVIITVGDDEASKVYVKGKMKDCEYCGIPVEHIKIEDTWSAGLSLIGTIEMKNKDDGVAGIIVQLPLPKRMQNESMMYCNKIVPWKDVDGLNSKSWFEPCTPKGIVYLLEKELGDLTGKDVLIIGRSQLVGKPLAKMLLDKDCTVTMAHSKTKSLYRHMVHADIVVSAVGKAKCFDLFDCQSANVVVDVGINRDENGKLCGDFEGFYKNLVYPNKITPVPKGVGLLTRAMLMKNVAEASQERNK